jgi:magnesium transporter
VQVLSEVGDEDAEKIFAEMPQEEAEKVRGLRSYSENEVGSLLELDPLAVSDQRTVAETLADLRANPEQIDGTAFYLYVVDSKKRLRGVVPLRRLLAADPSVKLSRLMVDPITVDDHSSIEAVADLFDSCDFLVLPVVDQDSVLLGTIERSEVGRARAEHDQESWLETQGIIGGEELRSLPYHVRSGRRLSWLSVNVVLNLIAASVIAFYQDTLAQVLALAMFLPIISDMSGCSGNQAVAVSLRELSLGLVRPIDLLYVLRKELIVGVMNGVALGLLLGGVAWFWQGNAYLGLVVGGALAINTVVAVSLGGAVPLVLTRLRQDPALASGPILTTVTDMCGFFLALSFATLMLSRLVAAG